MSVDETPGDEQRTTGAQDTDASENPTVETAEAANEADVADMADPGGDDDPSDELDALRAELEAARQQAAEHWDRLVRLQAEMDNQRKRAQKDLESARKFAVEGLLNDLLPVKDSLEMGIVAAQADDADISKILEGSDLTLKMIGQTFEKYNVVEIDPLDQKFDPEFHQAMSMQEVAGKDSNTVINVLQKGYTLNERLVRPALVIVAR